MITKTTEREAAIKMRRSGKTYNEIRKLLPVAKSTLSIWLRDVTLSNKQQHRLTESKKAAQKRGTQKVRDLRIERTEMIFAEAKKDIGPRLIKRELFLIGVSLYWAEGTKSKSGRVGTEVEFANSDPKMIQGLSAVVKTLLWNKI